MMHNYRISSCSFAAAGRRRVGFSANSILLVVFLGAFLNAGVLAAAVTGESNLDLIPEVRVSSAGVFLDALVRGEPALPPLRLTNAPPLTRPWVLSRAQVLELARSAGWQSSRTNWAGATSVRICRACRALSEAEVIGLLTQNLQTNSIKDRGELELRFSRPWVLRDMPDEPLTLKVLELPANGVTPYFVARFELRTSAGESFGPFQEVLQAHVWREVWVTRANTSRGTPIRDAELARERRNILTCHEELAGFDPANADLEFAQAVSCGSAILARYLRPRTVIHRGQGIAAILEDGPLAITLKVQALEDGSAGQTIRARNPLSQRDLRGTVLDEQRIRVSL